MKLKDIGKKSQLIFCAHSFFAAPVAINVENSACYIVTIVI